MAHCFRSLDGTSQSRGSTVTLPASEFTGEDNSVARIDNLAIVPEPGTILLGGLGGLALMGRRREPIV